MSSKLFIATSNPGKLKELIESLEDFYPGRYTHIEGRAPLSAEETEDTFEGNAKIKSHALVKEICEGDEHDSFFVLADDSGLEVDELGGAPGVISARYAGDHVEPSLHIEKVIGELKEKGIASKESHARYVCALSLVKVVNKIIDREVSSRGTCEGAITYEAAGESGFGYDPVFWIPHRNCTMAEISSEEKNLISHRFDAFRLLKRL